MISLHSFASLKIMREEIPVLRKEYFDQLKIPPVAWTGRGACGGDL
jgi:hypothetical protein